MKSTARISQNNSSTSRRTAAVLDALLTLCIFLFFLGMLIFTPMMIDDLRFLTDYRDLNGNLELTLKGTSKYWNYTVAHDCARLSNLAFLPGILNGTIGVITRIIIALAGTAMVWMAAWPANGNRRPNPLFLLLIWCGILLFLPWRDYLFTLAFATNYIISAVLFLGTWMLAQKSLSSNSIGLGAACIGLAALTMAWHEGFGVPLLCGLLFVACLRRFKVPRWWWIMFIAMAAIVVAIIPGILSRMGREEIDNASVANIKTIALCVFLTIALIITAFCALPFRSGRKWMAGLMAEPTFAFCAAAAVASTAIVFCVSFTPRTSFLSQLAALICWAIIFRPVIARLKKWLRIAIATLIICVIGVQNASALLWQYRYYAEYREVMSEIPKGRDYTVYRDIIMPEDVPLTTLYFPVRMAWLDSFFLVQEREYKGLGHKYISVVPTALDRPDLSEVEVIDPTYGASIVDGVIFSREYIPSGSSYCADVGLGYIQADITLNDGEVRHGWPCYEISFYGRDGRMYYYIKPAKIRAEDVAAISFQAN